MALLSLASPRTRAVERVLVSLALIALIAGMCAHAQAPPRGDTVSGLPADAQVRDVTSATQLFGEIMSPFCPGLTLANCPSVYADTLRRSVRRRLEAGESRDAIMESLVTAFGEGVRAAPRARGIAVLLWVLPFVLLLGGGVLLGLWLRHRARVVVAQEERPQAAPISEADRARLVEVLRDYDA